MILEYNSVTTLVWNQVPTISTYMEAVNPYKIGSFITLPLLFIFLIRLYWNYRNDESWKPYERSSALRNVINLVFLFFSIFWAAAVSVFGTELNKQWFGSDMLGYESLLFFMSASAAFYLGCRAFLSNTKKEENDKTSPSSEVVKKAAEKIIVIQGNYEACLEDWILTYNNFDEVDIQQLEVLEKTIVNSIKNCMKNMLVILRTWTDDSGTVLKVNLLNVLDAQGVLKELEKNLDTGLVTPLILKDSPFFLFNDNWQSCLQRCDKVLINEQDLTQIDGTCDIPRTHSPICMPYSINEFNKHGDQTQPNLIGAPEALKSGSIKYVTPLKTRIQEFIGTQINGTCYSEHTRKTFELGLQKYYDRDTAASIISIPLSYIEPKVLYDSQEQGNHYSSKEDFTSVLNIYAHSNYILANNHVVQSYCQLTKPITDTLAKLVSMRLQLLFDIDVKRQRMLEVGPEQKQNSSGTIDRKGCKILSDWRTKWTTKDFGS